MIDSGEPREHDEVKGFKLRGTIEHNEWDQPDTEILIKALTKAEELLHIETPYKIRLFLNEHLVTDDKGPVGVVKAGTLAITLTGEITMILVAKNLRSVSQYSLSKADGEIVAENTTTRDEEIAILIGEELFHLSQHLSGGLPEIIDTTADYPDKYEQKHEKDAALFRVQLLASLIPEKWKNFHEIIRQSYGSGDYNLRWEKMRNES